MINVYFFSLVVTIAKCSSTLCELFKKTNKRQVSVSSRGYEGWFFFLLPPKNEKKTEWKLYQGTCAAKCYNIYTSNYMINTLFVIKKTPSTWCSASACFFWFIYFAHQRVKFPGWDETQSNFPIIFRVSNEWEIWAMILLDI